MSYQVLARKWRPKTFREMVGQEHVLKALINALDHNRLHHAYLFTGTRGVGKTTIARILAKCLNCEVGVSSEPCGQCTFCQSIVEGRFIDLIEVDAASRTKVEDTREMLENVQYAPTTGRYKVFLIDEVHMLSTHSFNALLKTLEEPPPHVKFLLATTDPQKLPATILSRCLQFNLKNMTPERIVGHLQHVLEAEMVPYDEQALWLLGRGADGSMRDALSLTDQAIAFGSGKLSESDVREMLGTIDHTAVYEIIDALVQAQGAQLLAAVQRLSEHAPDYVAALEELLTLLHRIAIVQAVPGASDNNLGDRERILAIAASTSAEDIHLFYQLGLNGRRDLPLAPDARSGFEMVLLRMLAFKPAGLAQLPQGAVNQAPAQTVDTQEVAPAKKSELASSRFSEPKPSHAINQNERNLGNTAKQKLPAQAIVAAIDSSASQEDKPTEGHRSESSDHTPVAAKASEDVSPILAPDVKLVVEPKAPQPESPIQEKQLDMQVITLQQLTPKSWCGLFERLGFGGVVGNIASHCVLEKIEGDNLFLLLDKANATLFNESYTERIQAHLTVVLNAPVNVAINVAPISVETPAVYKERLVKEHKQKALVLMQNDPYVQCLINDFSATLDMDSVEPVMAASIPARFGE